MTGTQNREKMCMCMTRPRDCRWVRCCTSECDNCCSRMNGCMSLGSRRHEASVFLCLFLLGMRWIS